VDKRSNSEVPRNMGFTPTPQKRRNKQTNKEGREGGTMRGKEGRKSLASHVQDPEFYPPQKAAWLHQI
jgi:hypothetical protein